MILKLVAFGFKGYIRDPFNVFDAIIVILSTVELTLSYVKVTEDFKAGGVLSAFRAIRLLRIFKIAREWHSF